eukprot:COSAG03_NODE_472_length_7647_cov_6.909910_5_plen_78_part_00
MWCASRQDNYSYAGYEVPGTRTQERVPGTGTLLGVTLRGSLLGIHRSLAAIIGSAAEANSRGPLVRIVKQEIFPMLR